jgi:aerobic carbon-monoxide dehydrogenase large subunit
VLERIALDMLPAIANRQQAEAKKAVLFDGYESNVAITWKAFRGNAD